ncbi:MAG: hypothetical protein LXA50_19885 [Betaproteobacteria bacterium]|nr:hypothetical protein [Betaproteobacteria bacterium]
MVHLQGVAVAAGARHDLGRDGAAGAAAVVDHELLSEFVAQPLADDAREQVGGAARCERHQEAHRLLRVAAGTLALRECGYRGEGEGAGRGEPGGDRDS